MFVLIAGFIALIACGISVAHHSEVENSGMNSYRDSEYRMMPYRA